MSDWCEITLEQFVSLQRGHDLTEAERKDGCIPVMGAAGQNGFHDKAICKGPGVVVGRSGASFGKVHYCTTDFWPHNTSLYVTDFHGNDPLFAYYFLKNIDFGRYNSGSAQPSLNRNFIYPIEIKVPCVEIQQAIAHILGTIDDKIELNRQMNETLEAMARAIFKSWFVDFDPVRAKMSGEPPESICNRLGITPDLLDLFANRLQDSELGEIPEGWKVSAFYDLAQYINGMAFRTKQFSIKRLGMPVIKISELKSGITDQTKFTESSFHSKYKIKAGDLLFSWSGSPDTSIDTFVWTGPDGWLNQHIFKIEFLNPNDNYFVYFLLRHYKPVFIEIARNKQTTGLGHVTGSDLKQLKTVVPPRKVIKAFNLIAGPIYERSYSDSLENQNIAVIRDSLLPKLLSGELPLPAEGEA